MNWQATFDNGLSYEDFLTTHGSDSDRARWQAARDAVSLTQDQVQLIQSFTRDMHVVVMAGAWCGDCVAQVPLFDAIASHNDRIRIRYFDRDAHPDLAQHLAVCGAPRVPAVAFVSEDWFEVGRYGDKTLAKYRDLVASASGEVCSTGFGESEEIVAAVNAEWLGQFERAACILRLSTRLREIHGD